MRWISRFFGLSPSLSDRDGIQQDSPAVPLTNGLVKMTQEVALQVSAVYACINLLSETVASLPIAVYENKDGKRRIARESALYFLMHDSPNPHMTPCEFWRTMVMQLVIRGNAYALIDRDRNGEALSIYPLATDQMEVAREGTEVEYRYTRNNVKTIYSARDILHLKGLGNGILGISKLDFMRAATTESLHAQETSNTLFGNANKPSGVLTVDHVLNKEQRAAIKQQFASMREGSASSLFVLEADMKYSQLSLTPAETQLLESRKFSVGEISRWFGIHPALIGTEAQLPGGGLDSAIEMFYKFTIRPIVVGIEQAITKSVLTTEQRLRYSVEYNMNALLRASESARYEIYSKALQNGVMTRNEVRRLENLEEVPEGNELTVQTNLCRLQDLEKITQKPSGTAQSAENIEPVQQ